MNRPRVHRVAYGIFNFVFLGAIMSHEISGAAVTPTTRFGKWCGFTLIEMLVVIAIIGVLAAMLAGPLMRARKSALTAGCQNLMKSYGTATTMYNNEWNMYQPDLQTYLKPSANFVSYFGAKSMPKDVVRCPDDATTAALGRLKHYVAQDVSGGVTTAIDLQVSIAGSSGT
jgi:prepilin-type N-terminal cleavage/methylation domain-containing protein